MEPRWLRPGRVPGHCCWNVTPFLGGIASFCLGMPINQMLPAGKSRSAVHDLLIESLRAYGDQAVRTGQHELWCNVEYLKVAILDALEHVGCDYLLH